jgi:hypothetical protein
MLRSLFFISALAVSALAGCTSTAASEESTSDDQELKDLSTLAIVEGSIQGSGKVTVGYEPESYGPLPKLPFIAVKILPRVAPATGGLAPRNVGTGERTVKVSGAFPGTPHVIVVDGSFKVLAATRAERTPDGAAASVDVSSAAAMVLVRDDGWVQPMQFDVEAEM